MFKNAFGLALTAVVLCGCNQSIREWWTEDLRRPDAIAAAGYGPYRASATRETVYVYDAEEPGFEETALLGAERGSRRRAGGGVTVGRPRPLASPAASALERPLPLTSPTAEDVPPVVRDDEAPRRDGAAAEAGRKALAARLALPPASPQRPGARSSSPRTADPSSLADSGDTAALSPPGPAIAAAPVQRPIVPAAVSLTGMTEHELRGALGEPREEVSKGSQKIWTYVGDGCVVEVMLFLDVTRGVYTALEHKTVAADERTMRGPCLRGVSQTAVR
ncbi:MAG: hypothetical protein AB7E79_01995 [Rhodospirillaceae bacterium]